MHDLGQVAVDALELFNGLARTEESRNGAKNAYVTRLTASTLLQKLVILLRPLTTASKTMCRDSEMLSAQFPIARGLTRLFYDEEDHDLQAIRVTLLGRLVEKFEVEHIR